MWLLFPCENTAIVLATVDYSCDSSRRTLECEKKMERFLIRTSEYTQPGAEETKCWHLGARRGRKYRHHTKLCQHKVKWLTTMVQKGEDWLPVSAGEECEQFPSGTMSGFFFFLLIWLKVLIIYVLVCATVWWNNRSSREGGMLQWQQQWQRLMTKSLRKCLFHTFWDQVNLS